MTGPVRVRPADGNDLDRVVEVGRAAWRAAHGSLFEPDLIELLLAKWWTKDATIPAIRAGRAFVAHRDDTVVGVASYGSEQGRRVIWKLYVLPEHQGCGAGAMLLGAVLARIAEVDDAAHMPFYDGTPGAAGFAARHGFVEDHREPETMMPDVVWTKRALTRGTP